MLGSWILHYRELAKGISVARTGKHDSSLPSEPYPKPDGWYEKALETKDMDAIHFFLKEWNPRVGFDVEHLKRLVEEVEADLKAIKTISLHTTDLKDGVTKSGEKLHSFIVRLFTKTSGVLKYTGASKFLHVLNPKIFVMWDDSIRKAYGCYGNGEGYYNFLIRMQWELVELIDSFREDFDCDAKEAIRLICKTFYKSGYKSITQLLDEYNYQKYTKKTL